jgi:epsin
LTLLEYLIKNGSERVVDYARNSSYFLKSLKNYRYVDSKGKDQGINIRNRSKEILELLADSDRIKRERKQAKANRFKYGGMGNQPNAIGSNGGMSSYSGGFGSQNSSNTSRYSSSGLGYSGSSIDTHNRSSSYGGRSAFDSFKTKPYSNSASARYDEDVSDEFTSTNTSPINTNKPTPKIPVEQDLFSFDDPAPSTSNSTKPTSSVANPLDEWGDFDNSLTQAAKPANDKPSDSILLANPDDDFDDDFGDFESAGASNTSQRKTQATNASMNSSTSTNINLLESQSNGSSNAQSALELKSTSIWGKNSNLFQLDNLDDSKSSKSQSNTLSMNQMAQQQHQNAFNMAFSSNNGQAKQSSSGKNNDDPFASLI